MNRLGINLWNWCAGLDDDCLRCLKDYYSGRGLPNRPPTGFAHG